MLPCTWQLEAPLRLEEPCGVSACYGSPVMWQATSQQRLAPCHQYIHHTDLGTYIVGICAAGRRTLAVAAFFSILTQLPKLEVKGAHEGSAMFLAVSAASAVGHGLGGAPAEKHWGVVCRGDDSTKLHMGQDDPHHSAPARYIHKQSLSYVCRCSRDGQAVRIWQGDPYLAGMLPGPPLEIP